MLTDNADSINSALLRQQQQRLAILKSIKVSYFLFMILLRAQLSDSNYFTAIASTI